MDQSKHGVERKRNESSRSSFSSSSSMESTIFNLSNFREAMNRGVHITHRNVVPVYDVFCPLADSGFPSFSKLPGEIQNKIWLEALRSEAERKVVLFDQKSGGLAPSVQLISSIYKANKAAHTLAMGFFNFHIEVFACVRILPHLVAERRGAKGMLRLNFEYTTLLLGYEWDHPNDETCPFTFPNIAPHLPNFCVFARHITAPLSPSDCALVRRIYQLDESPGQIPRWEPDCCWDCEWLARSRHYATSAQAPFTWARNNPFPNVWVARLLIVNNWYLKRKAINWYTGSDHEVWWLDDLRLRLVTCIKPPVRDLGHGEFEVDSDPDGE